MIDEKIKLLGDSFRGLWQIKEPTPMTRRAIMLGSCHRKFKTRWYVTFKYNGDYLETESKDTREKALDYAIDFLGL